MDKVRFLKPVFGTVGWITMVLGVILVLVVITLRIVEALDHRRSRSPLASALPPIHSSTSGSTRPSATVTAAGASESSAVETPPTVDGDDGGTEIRRPRRSLNWN